MSAIPENDSRQAASRISHPATQLGDTPHIEFLLGMISRAIDTSKSEIPKWISDFEFRISDFTLNVANPIDSAIIRAYDLYISLKTLAAKVQLN